MFIYRFAIAPVLIIITLLLALLGHKKTRQGLKLRSNSSKKAATSKDKVWIHAASGEFEYAKSLIASVKKKHPNLEILVTYFSPSYEKIVAAFPGVDLALPLPIDTPSACQSFLKKYKPQLLLIARTDLWPEMLYQCHLKKIPALLFSATSKKQNLISKVSKRFTHKYIKAIYCVTEKDKLNIETYFKGPVKVIGDTRYDQVNHRLQTPCTLNFDFSCVEKIITLGSTWPEDEKVLIPAIASQKKYKFVIAPHEPTATHIKSIQDQLESLDISWQLYSQSEKWCSDALIIDQIGLLADIYRFSDVTFVGGSFKSKVHSVMEPIGAGNLVIVGPKNKNNREAQIFKAILAEDEKPIVKEVQSKEDVVNYISNLSLSEETRPKILSCFKEHLGATSRLVADIFN